MAAPGMAFYLAGDRYPADRGGEQALCARLSPLLPVIRRQSDWLGAPPREVSIPDRLDRIAACVGTAEDVVLLARSSGARVATHLAARQKLRAVVCMAYPFQAPHTVLEPDRFAHLAALTVPTLILQGAQDEYGALEATERFRLSPHVRLAFLPGVDHGFRLSEPGWDHAATLVASFLNGALAPIAPDEFDEAYYLGRHPDVAAAVRDGRVASGYGHYTGSGWRVGRRFRQLPLPGQFAAGT